jgi:pimeloyl-ACP methyl ester carboxylesterase
MQPLECHYSINGLTLATLCWGDTAGMPVLALHGWLDNAASFSRLAPLLRGCHVVAVDLPGHGHSSHRLQQGSYNLWDDLLDLLSLVDTLGWDRFHLVGHSRGAMIATLLAVAAPERIATLSLLDGMVPVPVDAANCVEQLRRHIREYRRSGGPGRKIYGKFDDALQARCLAAGMTEETARPIVERGTEYSSLGYRWRHDTRVMAASAFKLTPEHVEAIIAALATPSVLLLAEQGVKQHFAALIESLSAHCAVVVTTLPGGHLEPDVAALVAKQLLPHISAHV